MTLMGYDVGVIAGRPDETEGKPGKGGRCFVS